MQPPLPSDVIARADAVVELAQVRKRYGRHTVLDGLDLAVARGEVVGLLGPNGSGKTTTLRIAAGYLWADAGEVFIAGQRLTPASTDLRARIGYLPERAPLYDPFTVQGYLEFVAAARGLRGAPRQAALARVCAACNLDGVRDRVIGRLSKGFRQRIGLAQALLGEPDVVLLDEPTNGLDPFQIVEARAMIRACARDRAVIISTHILQEVAALCTRVVFLRDGRLLEVATDATAQGAVKLEVLLHGPAPDTLRQALAAQVPEWQVAEVAAAGDDVWRYRLQGPAAHAARTRLTRALVAQGALLELRSLEATLEDRVAALCATPA